MLDQFALQFPDEALFFLPLDQNEVLVATRHVWVNLFLLVPTPLVYKVPRVSPRVTAPKPFPPTSAAGYAGPPSSLQTTPDSPALLSEGQSGVQHLLGLIRGVRREGKGSQFLPWWLRWIVCPPGA